MGDQDKFNGADAVPAQTKKYYADCGSRPATVLEQLKNKRTSLINEIQELETIIGHIKNNCIPEDVLVRFRKLFNTL